MNEDRADRDRLAMTLHQRGWSLRRIGAHPKVGMTAQGVSNALAREARRVRDDDGGVDMLLLFRGAREGNEVAVESMRRYTLRVDELMEQASLREHGRPLAELFDVVARQGLREAASDAARDELSAWLRLPRGRRADVALADLSA